MAVNQQFRMQFPPATLSNIEFALLELRHFQALLKLHPIELHAELGDEDSSL